MNLKLVLHVFLWLFFQCSFSQVLNRQVKGVLDLTIAEEQLNITAKAENLSKINQSLTYELKVFKEDFESQNKSSNTQSGRFVIQPQHIKELSTTAINIGNKKERTIVLLLIRNLDNEIMGKARKVIIDGKEQIDELKTTTVTPKIVKNDGIKLKGVVLERVRTKPGRDFYNFFYSQYLTYDFNDSRPILIEEIHNRGRNTKIFIKIDNKIIYEFFVQPRTEYLKMNVTRAIRAVYVFFEKKEKKYIVKY